MKRRTTCCCHKKDRWCRDPEPGPGNQSAVERSCLQVGMTKKTFLCVRFKICRFETICMMVSSLVTPHLGYLSNSWRLVQRWRHFQCRTLRSADQRMANGCINEQAKMRSGCQCPRRLAVRSGRSWRVVVPQLCGEVNSSHSVFLPPCF